MADGPPPAKRMKHNYDFTKTFDVLVGKEPNQKRFTVYHDLLVQHSDFFKAARSSRWTEADKPTTLDDHDPEIFSTYLHCLCFGAEAIKDRLSTITTPAASESDDSSSDSCSESDNAAINGTQEGDTEDGGSGNSPDSDSPENEERTENQKMEINTGAPQKEIKILVNGEEKEATGVLFVGNISHTVGEEELARVFLDFGEIEDVRILTHRTGRSKGVGYVDFVNPKSATKALMSRNGYELDGRRLRLDLFEANTDDDGTHKHEQQGKEAPDQTGDKGSDPASVATINHDAADASIGHDTSLNEDLDDTEDAKVRFLIRLYVLADKLIDMCTANLVIDELVVTLDTFPGFPDYAFINIVYACTPAGSPLRALFRDWWMRLIRAGWTKGVLYGDWEFPIDFLKDLIIETGRLHNEYEEYSIGDVFEYQVIGRSAGHYHQKVDSSQRNDKI